MFAAARPMSKVVKKPGVAAVISLQRAQKLKDEKKKQPADPKGALEAITSIAVGANAKPKPRTKRGDEQADESEKNPFLALF